jgi:hypothetical protein
MQLVPNQLPPERLLVSMEAQESRPVVDGSDSPFVLKGAGAMSGNSRWLFIGAVIGAMLLSVAGIVVRQYRDKNGEPLRFPTFIKARTSGLAAAGTTDPPPAIVIQLSADMVRVSAIALGHPRLAVINGRTVTEGDNVILQAPGSAVALILRVAKIGDGSIQLSDGKNLYYAQITIPSPAKPKSL